jgi:hypothetical protein
MMVTRSGLQRLQAQPLPLSDQIYWGITMDDAKSAVIGAAMTTGGEIDER